MTDRNIEPRMAAIEPTAAELDQYRSAQLDRYGWPDADSAPPTVIYIERPGPARPAVNVTFERPTAGGQIGAALIRALAAIPIAIAFGFAALIRALAVWATRAIPGDADRVAALAGLSLMVIVWLATLALLGPWRLNLVIITAAGVGFGLTGVVDRQRTALR